MIWPRNLAVWLIPVALTAGPLGCGGSGPKPGAGNGGGPGSAVDRVTAGPPQRKVLALYTTQPGRIEAFEEAPLYSKITGYVEKLHVDIGDRVEGGRTLVSLRVPEMHDDLTRDEALVAQSEAEVEQAVAAVRAAEAFAETARARVAQAEAGIGRASGEYERWKAEYERIDRLVSGGSVTRKLADETLNQYRANDAGRREAAADVDSAKAAINEATAGIDKARADQVAAEARRRVAEANLARARSMLDYAEIKAPFDGVITRRNIDTGHYVYPSGGEASRPLLVVTRTDSVRVFVDVPEMEASLVDVGEEADPVTVRVQALAGREFEAKVTRTAWALNPTNRSLRTEVVVPNPDGSLRPGMYATASILLERRPDVLALPVTAVLRDESGRSFCYRVDSGRLVRTPIEIGLRVGDEVEVVSGLSETDTVVLVRAETLRDGQPVEVITPEG